MLIHDLTADTRKFAPAPVAEAGMAIDGPAPSDELRELVRSTGKDMGLEPRTAPKPERDEPVAEDDDEVSNDTDDVDDDTDTIDYFQPKADESDDEADDELAPSATGQNEELLRFAVELGMDESVAKSMPDDHVRAVLKMKLGNLQFQQPQNMPPAAMLQPASQVPVPPVADPLAELTAATEAALKAAEDEGHCEEVTGLVKALRAEASARVAAQAEELKRMQAHIMAMEQSQTYQQSATMEQRTTSVNSLIDTHLNNPERYGTASQWTTEQAARAQHIDGLLYACEQAKITVTPTVLRELDALAFGSPQASPESKVQASKTRALKSQSKRRMGVSAKPAAPREKKWTGDPMDNPKLHDIARKFQQEAGLR